MKQQKAFGTYSIAKICHVTPTTVGRWIEAGKLPFFITAGGHRRVLAGDLASFLRKHKIPLPHHLKSGGALKVLIVDDDEVIRRLLRHVIRRQFPKAELHEAQDGYEAGEMVATLIPSLVLLDLRLPGIDGIKVCERIRQKKYLKGVKILAMSGFDVSTMGKRALQAGADDFLPKPFDMDRLVELINKLLRNGK